MSNCPPPPVAMTTLYKLQYGNDIHRLPDLAVISLADLRNAVLSIYPALESNVFNLSIACTADADPVAIPDDPTFHHLLAVERAKGTKSIKLVVSAADEDWHVIANSELVQSQKEIPSPPAEAGSLSASSNSDDSVEQAATLTQSGVRISHPNWLDAKQDEKVGAASAATVVNNSSREDEKLLDVPKHSFFCSSCQQRITGIRFKCLICDSPTVHLCETCDAKKQHDPLHAFIRILHPDQCPDTGVIAMKQQQARSNPFGVTILGTVGVPRRTVVAPREKFFAGWRIRNDSSSRWKPGWKLRFVLGEDMRLRKQDTPLQAVGPGEEVEILLEMQAPAITSPPPSGLHQPAFKSFRGSYRLWTDNNIAVGPPMDYEVRVVPPPPVGSSSPAAAAQTAKPSTAIPPVSASVTPAAPIQNPQIKPTPMVVEDREDDFAVINANDAVDGDNGERSNSVPSPPSDDDSDASVFKPDLEQLTGMGFKDRALNLRLLRQGRSVQQVVEFILNSP